MRRSWDSWSHVTHLQKLHVPHLSYSRTQREYISYAYFHRRTCNKEQVMQSVLKSCFSSYFPFLLSPLPLGFSIFMFILKWVWLHKTVYSHMWITSTWLLSHDIIRWYVYCVCKRHVYKISDKWVFDRFNKYDTQSTRKRKDE